MVRVANSSSPAAVGFHQIIHINKAGSRTIIKKVFCWVFPRMLWHNGVFWKHPVQSLIKHLSISFCFLLVSKSPITRLLYAIHPSLLRNLSLHLFPLISGSLTCSHPPTLFSGGVWCVCVLPFLLCYQSVLVLSEFGLRCPCSPSKFQLWLPFLQ